MKKVQEKYFENYKIKKKDLKILTKGIDLLYQSGLVDQKVLDNVRFITFDSEYLYVFTRGKHSSTKKFEVKEISSQSKTGFRIFKIKHLGWIGKRKKDYQGAHVDLICKEVEKTAIKAKKFPNERILYGSYFPEKILETVSIPPYEPFIKIHKKKFSYLTDLIFHESAHIEHRRLENWQLGEKEIVTFPSKEKENEFLKVIRKTKVFPRWFVNFLTKFLSRQVLNEMYAIAIDREAGRRYDFKRFKQEEKDFSKFLNDLKNKKKKLINPKLPFYNYYQIYEAFWSHHTIGRLLVRILEENFPNFEERKNFLQWLFKR